MARQGAVRQSNSGCVVSLPDWGHARLWANGIGLLNAVYDAPGSSIKRSFGENSWVRPRCTWLRDGTAWKPLPPNRVREHPDRHSLRFVGRPVNQAPARGSHTGPRRMGASLFHSPWFDETAARIVGAGFRATVT